MKIKNVSFFIILLIFSACITKKPVVQYSKLKNDGSLIVTPQWKVEKTFFGKFSPFIVGIPLGLASAGILFEVTGEFPGMEFFTLGSVIAAPLGVLKFNNKILKRARNKPVDLNNPNKWLKEYNKLNKTNYKYAYKFGENQLLLTFKSKDSITAPPLPTNLRWTGNVFIQYFDQYLNYPATLSLIKSNNKNFDYEGYISYTTISQIAVLRMKHNRRIWVYGKYNISDGTIILKEVFQNDHEKSLLPFSYSDDYIINMDNKKRLNGYRVNNINEISYKFKFKRPKNLTKRELEKINKERPVFNLEITGDTIINKGSTGNIALKIMYKSLYQYSGFKCSITSNVNNGLTYSYEWNKPAKAITSEASSFPLFSLTPNKLNSKGITINSTFTEKNNVPITIKLYSGDVVLLERNLVLKFIEDESLKNEFNSPSEIAAGHFIYDSIFNPTIGQKKLESLAKGGSVEAACWLAIFAKLGYIHHPTSLYLTNRALIMSNYGDSLLTKAIKGKNENLLLLSFMREARNYESKAFVVTDSRTMVEKSIKNGYYPALWANKIGDMNIENTNYNLKKSTISLYYNTQLRQISNIKPNFNFDNFSYSEIDKYSYIPEVNVLNSISSSSNLSEFRINLYKYLNEENKETLVPLVCKLISLKKLNSNSLDKSFSDSILNLGVKMNVAIAKFEVGKKKIESSDKEGIALVEESASLGYKPAFAYLAKEYFDRNSLNSNEKKAIYYIEAANFINKSKEFKQNYDYTNHSWGNVFNNIQIDEVHEVKRTYMNGALQSEDESKSVSILGSIFSTAMSTLLDSWKQSQPNYNEHWVSSYSHFDHHYGIVMGELSTNIVIPAGSYLKKVELGEISSGFMADKSKPKGFDFVKDEKKKEVKLPYLSLMYKIDGIWYRNIPATANFDRKISAIAINELFTLNNIGYYTYSIDIYKPLVN
jgi:hypothetical protein